MITYEYQCESCGCQLKSRQAITEEPVIEFFKCDFVERGTS
jgi:predicted nucleic acid-binding Zn ribbon protein